MILQNDLASIYYETAGQRQPILFLHAGVADSRQWNGEFDAFAKDYAVVRYDMRGYGKSEPVAGEFTHLKDLEALVAHLSLDQPAILVGCSMGGGTALDFALEHPEQVRALVLVDSAPSGLQVDVPSPPKFALVDAAEKEGDLALVCELETQIWFDGDRDPAEVNKVMRKLAYDMNLLALEHDAKNLGEHRQNTKTPAIDRLQQLEIPVLAVLGENDIPYMHKAVEVMATKISHFEQVTLSNAAHLPNLDQPEQFQAALSAFISRLPN